MRSRHADGKGGGDFSRSARQQAVLEAVKKRLLSVQMLPKLPALIMQIATMINILSFFDFAFKPDGGVKGGTTDRKSVV